MDIRRKYVVAPRDLAAAHYRSASVIEAHCEELDRTEPGAASDHGAMYISSAMLRAFCIELALKSLRYAESSRWDNGHSLERLFRSQSLEAQHEIRQIADADLTRPFDEVISEISNVFVDWRYVHEKFGAGADIGFDTKEMKTIAHAVLQVLDDRIVSTS